MKSERGNQNDKDEICVAIVLAMTVVLFIGSGLAEGEVTNLELIPMEMEIPVGEMLDAVTQEEGEAVPEETAVLTIDLTSAVIGYSQNVTLAATAPAGGGSHSLDVQR